MVELSKSQDDEIGDGTTGVVVLAGELIKEAGNLLQYGVHPTMICNGFDTASSIIAGEIEKMAINVNEQSLKEIM